MDRTNFVGAKCGSAFIDTEFKRWLRGVLGTSRYSELDPANARQRISAHTVESGPMRELIKRFEVQKKAFSSTSQDIKLELRGSLSGLNIEGRVKQGDLTIYQSELLECLLRIMLTSSVTR